MGKISRNGIYYDLSISPYKITIEEITYVFSSTNHLNKFTELIDFNRKRIAESLSNRFKLNIQLDRLADLVLYSKVESRGFHIEIEGDVIQCLGQVKLSGEKRITKK